MGHMRYLPMDHPWRPNKRAFDDTQERECAPDVQSGNDILGQLEGMVFGDESPGKTKEKKQMKENKRKRGIFGRSSNLRYCVEKEKCFLSVALLER
jgi:hypothetical protein